MFSWTDDAVREIVEAEKWVIEIAPWRAEPGMLIRRRMHATAGAPMACPELSVVGTHGPTYWGYALLVARRPVRRFDCKAITHRNPDGTDIVGPHKHTWDVEHLGRIAYVPDDIDFGDVTSAFTDVLAECNIALGGCTYQPLMPL